MKYLILLFATIYLSETCKSQTKEETEKWIIEKLTKYSKSYTTSDPVINFHYTDYFELHFAFDQYFLIFSYKEKKLNSSDTSSYSCSEKLPMYDFTNISYIGSKNALYISTSKSTIITSCQKKQDQSVSSMISFYFNGNAETDLEGRLNKAFTHLKSFYKKPKSNETF